MSHSFSSLRCCSFLFARPPSKFVGFSFALFLCCVVIFVVLCCVLRDVSCFSVVVFSGLYVFDFRCSNEKSTTQQNWCFPQPVCVTDCFGWDVRWSETLVFWVQVITIFARRSAACCAALTHIRHRAGERDCTSFHPIIPSSRASHRFLEPLPAIEVVLRCRFWYFCGCGDVLAIDIGHRVY